MEYIEYIKKYLVLAGLYDLLISFIFSGDQYEHGDKEINR